MADALYKAFTKTDIFQQAAFRLDCLLFGSFTRIFATKIELAASLTQINFELRLSTGQKLNAKQQVVGFEAEVFEQVPKMVESVSKERLLSTQMRFTL